MRMGNEGDRSDSSGNNPAAPSAYWRVGLVLLGIVVVVVAGGIVLNARLKPPVGEVAVAAPPTALPSVATTAPASTPIPTSSTPTASPEAAVKDAYQRYWDVYSRALYTLDPSKLDEVAADDELTQARQAIDNLRAENHAARTDVEHHFAIVSLSGTQAVIQDEYLNRSYLIDAVTKQALQTPTSPQTENISCQLALQDGVWKVVKVTRITETITH